MRMENHDGQKSAGRCLPSAVISLQEEPVKSRIQLILLVFALTALLLPGCAQPEAASSDRILSESAPAPFSPGGTVRTTAGEAPMEAIEYERADGATLQQQERLIIRTGELRIVVRDTEESVLAITRLVDDMEGWVVSSNLQQRGEAKIGTMTIRIPAAQFDTARAQIKDMAVSVTSEYTSGQDVTEEYVDLSARLGNLQATAARVRTFLDEARNVEEALEVNRELSRLESEIEAMKGRLQYLEQSAAFSTLTVHLTPDALAQPIQIGSWRPEGTARNAIQSLVSALQGLADTAIWIILFLLPLMALTLGPIWLGIRFVVRLWRGWRSKPEAAPSTD
jgi:hypothetical protein